MLLTFGVFGWGVINAFIAAVNAELLYHSNRWLFPSILFLVIFSMAPISIILIRHIRKPAWLSSWINHRSFHYLLLLGIAFIILIPPLPEAYQSYFSHNLILAGCSLVSSLLLVLFYRQDENNTGLLIFTIAWSISIIVLTGVVPKIVALSLPAGEGQSLWTAFILELLFCCLPMVLPGNLTKKMLEAVAKIPLWGLAILALLLAATRLSYQVMGGDWWLVELAFVLCFVLFIVITAIKLSQSQDTDTESGYLDDRKYWGLITLFVIAYAILAFIIGKNGLLFLNNDGIAYYQIAKMAADGRLMINGYRAPVLSWLIAPFILLGSSPEIGERVISGLAGLAWAAVSMRLARNFGLSKLGRLGVGLSVGLVALHHTFFPVTPDMLGAVLLMGYFIFITENELFGKSSLFFLISGVSAALAYYAKYYNLPYVVAHLAITLVLYKMKGEKWGNLIKAGVLILATLSILVAPWIIQLSSEYGKFTYSTGGEVNHAYVGPVEEDENAREGLCVIPEGVLTPGMLHPISCYPAAGWSAFDNFFNFSFQVDTINRNAAIWINRISELGPFFILGLIMLVLMVFLKWDNDDKRFKLAWLILSSLLYVAGYLLLFASDFRYYFPVYPLVIMAVFMFLEKVLAAINSGDSFPKRNYVTIINAIIVFSIALTFSHYGKIYQDLTETSSSCMADEAPQISEYIEAPFAGITNRYIWNGKHIAYYTQKQTFGYIDRNIPLDEIPALLQDAGVKTLIAPVNLEISGDLRQNYGFPLIKEISLCGQGLYILSVP